MGLVVALPEPREDAEYPGVSLCRERPISSLIDLAISRRGYVTVDHDALDLRRNVAACILDHRGQIVSGMAGKRVLEVE